ncbi:MAG: Rieske (2Fe-2S) protein [Sphingobacteriaceae bacterium]|nr:Rieske (2Fe-2S) protein [Sphingobacteriaceae bacterium]
MDRKEFIKTCGFACLGMVGITSILESCVSTKLINTTSTNNLLTVARTEFIEVKKDKSKTRRHILVKTSELNFPIVVYRFSDSEFSALLLECSHQGSELNVNGDLLTCPAHGSEFSNKGEIIQGPADKILTSYIVSSDINNIYIHLA